VLPHGLASDPDRLARFQREAEVLASLNHPNIAQIHGLERGDDTTALVMELVDGPTLAERLKVGSGLSLTARAPAETGLHDGQGLPLSEAHTSTRIPGE